jgi:hypothetical protein
MVEIVGEVADDEVGEVRVGEDDIVPKGRGGRGDSLCPCGIGGEIATELKAGGGIEHHRLLADIYRIYRQAKHKVVEEL